MLQIGIFIEAIQVELYTTLNSTTFHLTQGIHTALKIALYHLTCLDDTVLIMLNPAGPALKQTIHLPLFREQNCQ